MAAHRYWRLVGFDTYEGGTLELSEARLYADGSLVDGSATLTCTVAPTTGALSDLRDGSTANVVSWTASKYKVSGFALVWDLTGTGASVDGIKIGSGSSVRTFPYALTLQWSDNATVWTRYDSLFRAAYPGAFSLSAEGEVGDPTAPTNVALLHFDGPSGSTDIVDATGRTWTASGGAALSTEWVGAFGGSSASVGGSKRIYTSSSSDLEFGASPFTISLRIYMATNPGLEYKGVITKDDTNGYRGWRMMTHVSASGKAGFLFFAVSVGGTTYTVTDTVSLATGEGIHIAAVRDEGGYLRLYKNGVQVAQTAITGAINTTSHQVNIGALINLGSIVSGSGVDAYIDEVRICKAALYPNGTSFTSPTSPWLSGAPTLMAIDDNAPKYTRNAPIRAQRFPGSARPESAAYSILKTRTFADVYNGGWGVVAGTVKQKGTPANTPLRRRVELIDEQSRVTIRETWSDAVTGNYEFRGVKAGVPYTVLSYDHTHGYRATVADNLFAEAMA